MPASSWHHSCPDLRRPKVPKVTVLAFGSSRMVNDGRSAWIFQFRLEHGGTPSALSAGRRDPGDRFLTPCSAGRSLQLGLDRSCTGSSAKKPARLTGLAATVHAPSIPPLPATSLTTAWGKRGRSRSATPSYPTPLCEATNFRLKIIGQTLRPESILGNHRLSQLLIIQGNRGLTISRIEKFDRREDGFLSELNRTPHILL